MQSSRLPTTADKLSWTRKRKRASVSCVHCRIRKLKCSRTQPCDSCLRTGDSDTCFYTARPAQRNDDNTLDQNTKEMLTARITKLEDLLSSVVKSTDKSTTVMSSANYQSDSKSDSPNNLVKSDTYYVNQLGTNMQGSFHDSKDLGLMKVNHLENQTIYFSSNHWTSIMSEVDELKRHLLEHDEPGNEGYLGRRENQEFHNSASLLRGTTKSKCREDISSHLPSRTVADALVNRFFQIYKSTFAFIHEPTFRKEYEDHWNNPETTKTVWLGLLFAVLHGAEESYVEAGEASFWDQHDLLKPRTGFNTLIVQCLIASDYTNPVAYTIETLMLYVQFCGIISPNGGIETSVVLGITVRLAMRMGIHRNSKAYPGITPFQDEMRRRLWTNLLIADILHSFQLSLPPSIGQGNWSSMLPNNIRSDDFDPQSPELPASRPFSEYTEATYTILKGRFLIILRDIISSINNNEDMSEQELQKFESDLAEADAAIPLYLRIDQAIGPPSISEVLQGQRIGFDRMYQLCRCMLYRKYVHRARVDPSLMQYRVCCIDAATKLLSHQAILFNGPISIFSATVKSRLKQTHPTLDFFVAGMIIALDLYHDLKVPTSFSTGKEELSRTEMIHALERSNQYWAMARDQSIEAAKAYSIFSFVLQKVKPIQTNRANNPSRQTGEVLGSPSQMEPSQNLTEPGTDFAIFSWDDWNAYAGDEVDFDAFLQWPSMIQD